MELCGVDAINRKTRKRKWFWFFYKPYNFITSEGDTSDDVIKRFKIEYPDWDWMSSMTQSYILNRFKK